MSEHIEQTIVEAEARLREQERAVQDTKRLINQLLGFMGKPAKYPDEVAKDHAMPNLMGDEYLGKTQTVAVRMILERRKALGLAPVTPGELYEDLVAGGFKFETLDIANRKRGLGQMLSKNSSLFYKLDNGKYGLVAWYPGLKKPKNADGEKSASGAPEPEPVEESEEDEETLPEGPQRVRIVKAKPAGADGASAAAPDKK